MESRNRSFALLAIVGATVLACGSSTQPGDTQPAGKAKRAVEGPKLTGKTAVPCTENTCTEQNGCATCASFEIKLPATAKVLGIHCYTNANSPKDHEPTDLHEVTCGQDVGWSVFDVPSQSTAGSNRVVRTTYHNRSNDRERYSKVEVEYQE
jgi:hypothetical protein